MTKRKPPELHKKRQPKPLEDRHRWTLAEIMERCDVEGDDECWEWRDKHGRVAKSERQKRYVTVSQGGTYVLLRRLAWTLKFGQPPADDVKLVPTKCNNPHCQNPSHCEAMTESEKCLYASRRSGGRSLKARAALAKLRRATTAKIDMAKANEIRADPRKAELVAPEYGISPARVKQIRRNEAWIDFDSPYLQLQRKAA